MKWLRKLYDWTMSFAYKPYGSAALSVVSFIEASFFLIPPEAIFVPLAAGRPKRAFYYAFLMTTFSVLGGIFGYFLGMFFWDLVSPFFFEYVFKLEQFLYVQELFQENTFWTIFVAGFTPIPFKVFTLSAGVVAAPLLVFTIASILSRGLRYFMLAALFYYFGPSIRAWIDKHFEKATIVITLICVAIFVGFQLIAK